MSPSILTLVALLAAEPLVAPQDGELPRRPNTTLVTLQPGERETPAPGELVIYHLRHLPVTEATALLISLADDKVKVIPDRTGNRLLILAPDAGHKRIQTILEALDQPPKMIALEITFADLPAPADVAAPAKAQISDEEWLSRLKDLGENSKGAVSKIRLTAVENQLATVQYGEQKPVVTGMQQGFGGGRGGPGGRSPVVQQTQLGTIVQCTARVSPDNTILAELNIERTQIGAPEDGVVLDESDDTGTYRTPGQLSTTCKTTLKLMPGKPHVISGLKSSAKGRGTHSVIVITAELINDNNPGERGASAR